jgi:hypothetical protein
MVPLMSLVILIHYMTKLGMRIVQQEIATTVIVLPAQEIAETPIAPIVIIPL